MVRSGATLPALPHAARPPVHSVGVGLLEIASESASPRLPRDARVVFLAGAACARKNCGEIAVAHRSSGTDPSGAGRYGKREVSELAYEDSLKVA